MDYLLLGEKNGDDLGNRFNTVQKNVRVINKKGPKIILGALIILYNLILIIFFDQII